MKKIELHIHLDGSLNKDYINELMKCDATKFLVSSNDKSLKEYLKKFEIPIKLTQTKENLEKFCELLAKDLEKDEVIYAEIRFCPLLHTTAITAEEAINSVLEGLSKVKNIKTNIILCMMRNFDNKKNLEIINLAKKYLNKGVVGIDLAGDEGRYSTDNYKNLFEIAQKENIPYTIHAGEASSYKSIESAINFKAKRIGHGVRSIENKETIEAIIKNSITLEICPTSNLNTNIYSSIKEHPIKKLLELGVKVTINTDNRTVSDTTLEKEYELLKDNLGFTQEDLIKCNLNSIEASFLNAKEKNELRKKLQQI